MSGWRGHEGGATNGTCAAARAEAELQLSQRQHRISDTSETCPIRQVILFNTTVEKRFGLPVGNGKEVSVIVVKSKR